MAEAAKQRVIALLRGQEAKRIRFTAATSSAGDITIDSTTFGTVASAIEAHKIQVSVKVPGKDDVVAAQYDTEAVPPTLGTIAGFSSGQLIVPPIVGREQERSVMHECTHAFFDLQSIDIKAAEEEAICYVVGALFEKMTGLPQSRWGTQPIYQGGYVVATGLLHQYQLGVSGTPRADDTDFKTLVLAVATDPHYISRPAGIISWLSGKDDRYDNDG
jgi:hypothetical protein